jgi:hypothetical protein
VRHPVTKLREATRGATARVQAGLVNVRGFVLALPNDVWSEQIFEDVQAEVGVDLTPGSPETDAVHVILNGIYEAAGVVRR